MFSFVTDAGVVRALSVPAGQTGVSCGGILYAAREPANAAERAAVRSLEADLKRGAQRGEIRRLTDADAVGLMAVKIVERTRASANVTTEDFKQAGIPDDMIAANRDAAFARARRMEPKLDAMVSA